MKSSCPASTPRLKARRASGTSPCGQPDLEKRAREAEPVQQPEGEGHGPGVALGEALLLAGRMQELGGEEGDG
jgi:hypothetical protein